jgi:uncharacterized protein involved in outer membrane biogenesis
MISSLHVKLNFQTKPPNMIKKLFLFFILLVVAGLAALYFFGFKALNSGVKQGIESIGPKVTQTTVALDSVNLSPFSGSGSMKGLVIGNPEGFAGDHLFKLGQIDISIDTGSVFSDTVVIEKIHIMAPDVSYEKTLRSSNIKELQKNIEEFTGPKADEPDDPGAAAKKLVIKELIIEDGTIFVGALGVGQTVPLPRIEMTNLGEDGTSANVGEVLNEVLGKVLGSVGPAIANAGELSKQAVKALKTQGLEKADQAADKAKQAAGDTMKKADEAAKKASESVSDGIKNILGN